MPLNIEESAVTFGNDIAFRYQIVSRMADRRVFNQYFFRSARLCFLYTEWPACSWLQPYRSLRVARRALLMRQPALHLKKCDSVHRPISSRNEPTKACGHGVSNSRFARAAAGIASSGAANCASATRSASATDVQRISAVPNAIPIFGGGSNLIHARYSYVPR